MQNKKNFRSLHILMKDQILSNYNLFELNLIFNRMSNYIETNLIYKKTKLHLESLFLRQ